MDDLYSGGIQFTHELYFKKHRSSMTQVMDDLCIT